MIRYIVSVLWAVSSVAFAQTLQEHNAVHNVSADAATNIKFDPLLSLNAKSNDGWKINSYWENRYITEGRDNLANKGIASLSTELTYKDLVIIPWFAKGINADYAEINLNLIYTMTLSENLELFTAYNRIQSREQGTNEYDNEVSLELVYSFANQLQLLSNIYHSFAAQGTFLDVVLIKQYQLTETLSLDVQAHAGFNSGYIVYGHNGINHMQFSANFSYSVMENLQFYTYSNYSFAINKDSRRYVDDTSLQDVFWGAVGFSYHYN